MGQMTLFTATASLSSGVSELKTLINQDGLSAFVFLKWNKEEVKTESRTLHDKHAPCQKLGNLILIASVPNISQISSLFSSPI